MVAQQKTIWVFLALFLCVGLVPGVSASAYSTVFTAIDNEILPNETAVFEVAISNFGLTETKFQIYTIDPNWVAKASPSIAKVGSDSTETFELTLRPKTGVPFGSQGITINVKNLESGDLVRKTVFAAVKSYDEIRGTFIASVAFDILLNQNIDPSVPQQMQVNLRNRNPLDIENMTLTINSEHFSHYEIISLGPLTESIEYFPLKLSPSTPPGDFSMHGELLYKDEVVSTVEKQYTIAEYSSVQSVEEKASLFFQSVRTFTLENIGNSPETVEVVAPLGFFARMFTGSNEEGAYEKGQYRWEIVVGPEEQRTITLSTNYRYLLAFIVLVILGIIGYYLLRSPLVLLKEVVSISKGEGVSQLKIRVFVRNRSNKVIQGVEVLDKVPRITKLVKTHALGTIKPTRVDKLKSGTMLRWDLDILEPYEERILTYTLESTLRIVGKVSPPLAKVKFNTGKGQERIALSNNVTVDDK